jgi:hypothetical protein
MSQSPTARTHTQRRAPPDFLPDPEAPLPPAFRCGPPPPLGGRPSPAPPRLRPLPPPDASTHGSSSTSITGNANRAYTICECGRHAHDGAWCPAVGALVSHKMH